MSSQVTNVIALYFAFAFDLATTFCFLLFHDIKVPPTRTQYPPKWNDYPLVTLPRQDQNTHQFEYFSYLRK